MQTGHAETASARVSTLGMAPDETSIGFAMEAPVNWSRYKQNQSKSDFWGLAVP